ncbi:SRPBCC family protein [Paenibacillus alkalitolerans]|uniref:SRPBCC family protein n=1 Tax=Paenibacillus alkalitolerans TaxID=2799335 RepID=UPI0018F61E0D|nr:SRPBCC domain-containing protein [Paenibacillus alkalitolerans]
MGNDTQKTLPDIEKKIVLNAPIMKVWHAVATSEGIAAWFMPNNFKPESGFKFQLDAGPFGMSDCEVTELDPPNRLSFQWGEEWTVTFKLTEMEGKTEFTLIHSGWVEGMVTPFGETHNIVRDRMSHGWGGLVEKLGAYVEV